jgi:hypothetical protein
MRSKLISALAATALIAAVPSIAAADDNDDNDGISTAAALGVIFTLIAGVILLWDDGGNPVSP